MTNKRFKSLLTTVKNKLFPDCGAEILSPESPPDWTRLGWKVGWIIEEGHTGLQWWLTEDVAWNAQTKHFGNTRRQKKESFARWYGEYLDELASELGVPLSFDSLRYRQMDVAAFEGRPLIQEEDWWQIRIQSATDGEWVLIVSERFVQVFEEDRDHSPEPDPPWTFLELWGELDETQRQQFLQEAGTREGILNHLASLVVSGNIDLETFFKNMARQPREELEQVVDDRRSQLDNLNQKRRSQNLDQWKGDAVHFLTKTVGDWLLEKRLPVSDWENYRQDWMDYRNEKLRSTFDEDRWGTFWGNFESRDVEQIIPRLDSERLAKSFRGVNADVLRVFREALPDARVKKYAKERSKNPNDIDVYKSRKEIYEDIKATVEQLDYEMEGELSLNDTEPE